MKTGEIVGLGVAGLGVWWLGSSYNWFGLFGATPAVAATPSSSPVTAAVVTPASSTNPTQITPVTLTAAPVVPPPPPVNAYPLSSTIPNATATAASLASALIARATSDGIAKGGLVNGQIAYTPQQWNYVFNELYPGSQNLPSSSQVMSAGMYALQRATAFGQTAGLSGYGMGRRTMTGAHRINYVRKSRFA